MVRYNFTLSTKMVVQSLPAYMRSTGEKYEGKIKKKVAFRD